MSFLRVIQRRLLLRTLLFLLSDEPNDQIWAMVMGGEDPFVDPAAPALNLGHLSEAQLLFNPWRHTSPYGKRLYFLQQW